MIAKSQKAVTENKQHGNKQQKKTTLFFDHFGTFAYDSKITIFAVELGIFTYSTYQRYFQAGFSVLMSAADPMLSVHHEFRDRNVLAFKHLFKIKTGR